MSEPITGLIIDQAPDSEISKAITELTVSWTMDGASEVMAKLIDPNMGMFLNNYFQRRREVTYRGQPLEIAATEIDQGEGGSPLITIECRSRGIQRLKRDKKPGSISGASGTDYARAAAETVGLKFVGQPGAKKQTIAKVTSGNAEESTWDVLARTAGENQYVVFESDGTLYYATETWLLGKWANVVFRWPSAVNDPFTLMQIPQIRASDDDPYGAQFRVLLDRTNAKNLRPGMTVNISGMGAFDAQYLITEVSYREGVADPVSVSGRTAAKLKDTDTTNNKKKK